MSDRATGTDAAAILCDRRDGRCLPVIGLAVQGQNPAELRLNELGDFLGGVSSPLAFL